MIVEELEWRRWAFSALLNGLCGGRTAVQPCSEGLGDGVLHSDGGRATLTTWVSTTSRACES